MADFLNRSEGIGTHWASGLGAGNLDNDPPSQTMRRIPETSVDSQCLQADARASPYFHTICSGHLRQLDTHLVVNRFPFKKPLASAMGLSAVFNNMPSFISAISILLPLNLLAILSGNLNKSFSIVTVSMSFPPS